MARNPGAVREGSAPADPPAPQREVLAARLTTTTTKTGERVARKLMLGAALFSVLVTAGIIFSLVTPAWTFFQNVNIFKFLTGTEWTAGFGGKFDWDKDWGVLPLVLGTAMSTLIAVVIAVPLGLGCAVLLSEYASPRLRKTIKPMLEVLAGVPTVVYGFLALKFLTPLRKEFLPGGFYSQLSAGLVLGFMLIPTIASLAEDAMSSVPNALRQGSYALGANRMTTTIKVVFPAALSGIIAAIVLAISRAVGETMILAIAAGNEAKISFNPLEGAQTMTGFIAQVATGDAPQGSPVYYSLFAVGSLLFVITLVMNMISIRTVRKFRQVY